MATTTLVNGSSIASPTLPLPPPHLSPFLIPFKDELTGGLKGAIGCDYIPTSNQLAFVEYDAGDIAVFNLIRPLVSIVSQGTTTLKGTWIFDCETGAQGGSLSGPGDIWWEQETATQRRMTPVAGAKILNLGHVNYASVNSASLQLLTYTTTPIPGNTDPSNQLTNGDVFAVFTNAGNFCKVQVLAYGYDMQIQWATYKVGPQVRVLGSGYAQPEDIVVAADGMHAFVTERTGNVLRVDLSNAGRAFAHVLASGLNAPQQICFDATRTHLFAVEFAPSGRLLKIDASSGATSVVTNALDHAIGIQVSADDRYAYVSEQSAAGGRVRKVDTQTGTITPIATGFTAPFMLSWTDATREQLLLCERDPANRLAIIDLANGNSVTRPLFGLGFRPSDTAVLPGGRVLVTCDTEIDDCYLAPHVLSGPLFKGIGYVPVDKIVAGRAKTDPGYFFNGNDAAFGGVLPIKVNHYAAFLDGAAWYQVLVDGAPRADTWTDYKWNPVTNQYELQTIAPATIGFLQHVYPVRTLADLLLWYNADLGSRVDSTAYADGSHPFEVRFYNAVGGNVTTSGPVSVLLDNTACQAQLAAPQVEGKAAGAKCGVLDYAATGDGATFNFSASQKDGDATFSLIVQRGADPPISLASGNATTAVSWQTALIGPAPPHLPTVGFLLDGCTIAGFVEELYVAANITSGEVRQSQYDAWTQWAFVLAPA